MTNAQYKHLLLTRFNIYMGEALGPSAQRLEDEWLLARLREFELFCLPSVRAQTAHDFTWLVFCDESSPDWFKERMHSFAPLVTPVFSQGITRAQTGQTLSALGFTEADYLITTRLDNDDAISNTFIERVQSHFHGQVRGFVDFPRGVRAYRGGLYTGYWRSNPFISMIERRSPSGFETVFAFPHDKIRGSQPIHTDWTPDSWLRSIHAANSVVTAVGLPRISARSSSFSCLWDELPAQESFIRRCRYSARGYLNRVLSKRRVRAVMAMLDRGRRL